MAMGIVSSDDFDSEASLHQIKPEVIKPEIVQTVEKEKGRGKGNVQVPDSLRKVIGETSAVDGRSSALELAKSFGISPSSVSAYDNGAHSTSSYDTTPNKPYIEDAKLKVTKRARNKLMLALANLTSDKISEGSARDISGIAKDMSVIIRNMEPDQESNKSTMNNNGPTFVLYAPQVRDEKSFETVYAKE